MRGSLILLLAVGVVLALGRMFDTAPTRAEAGEGAAEVAGNGDVNGDGGIDVSDASYLLNWLFLGGPAPQACPTNGGGPSRLPDTGQTTCYADGPGFGSTNCPEATCPGQDGAYATGCSAEGRFVDNGDGTVTDDCTGLMWQKDTGNDGEPLSWCDALAYCENLELGGHDDWRLPNVRELQSIVDYGRDGRVAPTVDAVFSVVSTPTTHSSHWSSTSEVGNSSSAFRVLFSGRFNPDIPNVPSAGGVNTTGKQSLHHVRAVRCAP